LWDYINGKLLAVKAAVGQITTCTAQAASEQIHPGAAQAT